MASPRRIRVDDRSGDGPLLALLPAKLRDRARPLALRSQKAREKRLLRVGRAVYPAIRNMERLAIGESQRLLSDTGFDECCRDARCIERALTLFEVAWQTGLTELLPTPKGQSLSWGNTGTRLGACGLTVGQAQQFFLKMAVKIIFKANPQAYERLAPFIDEKSSLPRMRLLASVDALSLAELQLGWGRRFAELLTGKDDHYAAAIRRLKPFQVRSMRQIMGPDFLGVLEWPAEMVDAVAESFQCVEQFRDLGDFFVVLTTPEAVRAVGRWERRDITERVNEDRKRQGQKPVKGRRWETDIALLKRVLGTQFGTLLERDAGVIDQFGVIFATVIRPLEEPARGQAIEQFQVLAKRFLQYLTEHMLTVLLHPQGPDGPPFTFAEINGVLDGLWMKNGLGTAFFEGAFQTQEGIDAVRALASDFIEMKRRGSAKPGTDIAALIRDSDLFDRQLVPLMKKKTKLSSA